jgi:hypothetical protein
MEVSTLPLYNLERMILKGRYLHKWEKKKEKRKWDKIVQGK